MTVCSASLVGRPSSKGATFGHLGCHTPTKSIVIERNIGEIQCFPCNLAFAWVAGGQNARRSGARYRGGRGLVNKLRRGDTDESIVAEAIEIREFLFN